MLSNATPRAFRRADAAMYCGVGATLFDQLVDCGTLPKPRVLSLNVRIWLRDDLDRALFLLPIEGGGDTSENPCDILLR